MADLTAQNPYQRRRPQTESDASGQLNPAETKQAPASAPAAAGKPKLLPPVMVTVFIISLALPVSIYIGSLRLSPYRIVLIAAIIPYLIQVLSGKLGRVRPTDILMILFAAWGALALFFTTSIDAAIQPAGIFVIEALGAYLVARVVIRSEETFRAVARFVFWMLMVLLPFAIYETITDRPIIEDTLRQFLPVVGKGYLEPRLGLHRSQVVFDHPILYGAFATSILGLSLYVYRRKGRGVLNFVRPALVAFASILSVSGGAIAAMAVQALFIGWDYATKTVKRRWLILGLLFVALFMVINTLSNRSPFHVLVSYLTFSPATGYTRIQIWNFGSAEVWRHPLFGIGFADWTRPAWLGSSVDNFWLLIAMRHGIPAFLFLAGAVLMMFRGIGRIALSSETLKDARTGLIISLAGLIIAGGTVDYWNAIFCWFMFLIGSGMWMFDAADKGVSGTSAAGGDAETGRRDSSRLRRSTS